MLGEKIPMEKSRNRIKWKPIKQKQNIKYKTKTKKWNKNKHRQQIGGHQRRRGLERVKWVKVDRYMVTDENETFGGEHAKVCTDVEI